MQAKFSEQQQVVVDGHATGYGDVQGSILSIDFPELLEQPYYLIKVNNHHTPTLYVAEKFLHQINQ